MALASKSYSSSSSGSVNLVWPANLVDSFDYLQIDISDFVPRARRSSSSVSTAQSSTPAPVSAASDFGFALQIGNLLETSTTTTLKRENTILLPVPEDINYTDNPQWADQAVGVLGRFGPEVAATALGGDSGALTTAIQDIASAGSVSVILEAIRKAGADPNAITQNINGKIANPYMEQVFGGIGMREFSFSWKLVPRNDKEQKSIHSIIKTLRKAILPNKSGTFGDVNGGTIQNEAEVAKAGTNDRWLTVPKVFNLSWKYQGDNIESMPKIKTCICKNIQVSYTPDNVWATHLLGDNPYPVAYNLSLTFGEMEIITSADVNNGF